MIHNALFAQISQKGGRCTYLVLFLLIGLLLISLLMPSSAIAKKTNVKLPKPALANTHYYSVDDANEKNNKTIYKQQSLPKSVKKLLKKYKIPQNELSVYMRDLNSSSAMISHNVDKLRNPASTIKMLTTYAALKKLGPNYTWRTEIWLRGELEDSTLNGDIVLKGFGDPYLVNENFWKIVKALREKGLTHINGDVIIDNSHFQLPPHNPAAFDGEEFRVYNAPSSPLMFNFQATRFTFNAILDKDKNKKKNKNRKKKQKKKTPRGSISITTFPQAENVILNNKMTLTKGRCRKSHYRPKFSKNKKGVITIKGKYAARCKQKSVLRSVSNPENHVFNAFRDFWIESNGTITGGLKIDQIDKEDERFHVYSSPTLGELIRLMNKWSNNVMTKQLLLTLGAETFGAPATPHKGIRAILTTLAENNIDTKGIRIESGSGLSRKARVSARQMGQLLETAYRDAYMPEFIASLALLGTDGTLSKRFKKGVMKGRGHFKTGSLDFVSAISGYLLNRKGKRLVIVIQQNGKRTGGGRAAKIQNELLRWSFEQ